MSVCRICSVCGSAASRPLLADEGQPVVQCRCCGFVYCNPIPDPGELEEYYTESYDDWDYWQTTFRHDRSLVFREGLREIRRLQPWGRLLDVGCSLGFFLEAAREAGYDVTGVDVSRSAVAFARERLHLDARACPLEEAGFPAEHFDVVTLWDVLEHLPEPRAALDEAHRILRPGGLLVIRLPNVAFHLPKTRLGRLLCPGQFIGLDARNHLNHYSPGTLARALSGAGFEIVRRKPGPVNLYGKPVVDNLKTAYLKLANAAEHWTGAMVANIMEAYATKSACGWSEDGREG
ncbi:MAG: hypothetical protein COZ06_15655 [Armatimonadetes bacterium CG_4_10_14_3_um_filter_66_18]|nr:class I SAM-dependent methyltransferase [Armatimonadota bacterium]OIO94348.1 MAG: hypothetical protein AUJ96_28795 [Armatimonadetes bacterium CG2_30_66_41]PIU87794.1 MAG: hypothetical protein COS65_32885 [Armatimonadetes bacterium CG06_land_8_20_14_3_00_66_21]PIW13677.1 MAG: hypothetical protein COW34_08400 [Armatimonadetes bacterium CG17_big_fil_post_rev_8_21_14_2_50_66_6]PIX40989.1 MAG: hypothetical protein COZ57_24565 [Armatimonadetes bacterium CG_4_8_14_3_um_filter_66_20]PIY48832.1 MAG: